MAPWALRATEPTKELKPGGMRISVVVPTGLFGETGAQKNMRHVDTTPEAVVQLSPRIVPLGLSALISVRAVPGRPGIVVVVPVSLRGVKA